MATNPRTLAPGTWLKNSMCWALTMSTVLVASACGTVRSPASGVSVERDSLVGAWRSQVRFNGGVLADMKDLEFMYVFNAGGTMTESSNHDGAPPVPPAYGVWRKRGPRQFEASYAFYITRAPETFADIAKGGGWPPAGRGILTESITLADDGRSFQSTIIYSAFDQAGKPVQGGGEGAGAGARMGF